MPARHAQLRPQPRVAARPAPTMRSARQQQIVELAAGLLEAEGADALTMRRLAEDLGIRAPSLYKHLDGKPQLLSWLAEDAMLRAGDRFHSVVDRPGRPGPVRALLSAYRTEAVGAPHHYRLLTGPGSGAGGPGLPLPLRAWAGEPFWRVMGEPHLAQALWAFAHGAVVLEVDQRFLNPGELDRTWRAGAAAFSEQRRA